MFSYDPIGCIENVPYNVSGSATAMIEPFFDAQVRLLFFFVFV